MLHYVNFVLISFLKPLLINTFNKAIIIIIIKSLLRLVLAFSIPWI